MKRCDTEGCDQPTEHRWCEGCWAAYDDFRRDGGDPVDVVEEARAFMRRHPETFTTLAKQERGDQ